MMIPATKAPEKTLLFLLTMLVLFFCSCNGPTVLPTNAKAAPIINLQPYTDLGKAETDFVYGELRKIFPVVKLNNPIPLPQEAYYAPRNRYKADTLIKMLKAKTNDGHITMGLTSKDISTTKGTIPDFGIMGLGYQPGKACVVSAYRLHKRNQLKEFIKVAVHELGHTQGLPHCPVATCFMRDAKGGNPLAAETSFCESCKAVLVGKGWKL